MTSFTTVLATLIGMVAPLLAAPQEALPLTTLTNKPITALYRDGRTTPLSKSNTLCIMTTTDSVYAVFSWDLTGLTLQARVQDHFLNVSSQPPRTPHTLDALTLTFELPQKQEPFLVCIQPYLTSYTSSRNLVTSPYTDTLKDRIFLDMHLQGTKNNNSDNDTGYFFELFIPWHALDVTPTTGMHQKFSVQLTNVDTLNQAPFITHWPPHHHSSHWGSIILTGEIPGRIFPFIIMIVLVGGTTGVFYFIKKRKKQKRGARQNNT